MLQIISGKFFSSGILQEKASDAVLYSNLSWVAPITTSVAELRPTDATGPAVSGYVVRYTNRYEQLPGDLMVLANPDEAVDQFRLLCSFWFKAFFHTDRAHVELLCRSGPRTARELSAPRGFLPRYFDLNRMATVAEAEGFPSFVTKVLGMPRKQYNLVTACLGIFFDALEALNTNFDLAYSMLVYLLEALGQSEDGYVPSWDDYDPRVKERLEAVFTRLQPEDAGAIRSALLESAHLKLMKRFIGFVVGNVADNFFTTQAEGLTRALPRSRLERALRNLYNTRSGFVHQLKRVRDQLRVPWTGPTTDIFDWENGPYLSFSGLVRIAHHVLSTFIARQPVLDREDYSQWRKELPGIIQIEMAPQYWIWQATGLEAVHARKRFSGLVYHLVDMFQTVEKGLPHMSDVMERTEQMVPTAPGEHRRPLVALYWLYHLVAPPGGHRPGWEAFFKKYEQYLEEASIEFLAIMPMVQGDVPRWPAEDCEAAFTEYERRRYSANAIHLPAVAEVAIMAYIANLYLGSGDRDAVARWLDRAVLEAAGRKPIQDQLTAAKGEGKPVDTRRLLGLSSPNVHAAAPDHAE